MPRLSRSARLITAVLAGSYLNQAFAAPEEGQLSPADWSAEVAVGVEYDSNVSVEEVDVTSNQGDYAMTLDAGLGLSLIHI